MDKKQPAVTPSNTMDNGVKSYLVMVVLAFFASVTGLARAYRGEKVGWIRFWMFVGSYVLMIVPFLNILSGLALIVLSIWGIVDFFLVYRLRDDAEGKPLHATARDIKWAGVFNVLYIVFLALGVVVIILSIIFSAALLSGISNYRNPANSYNNSNSSSSGSNTSTTASEKDSEAVLSAYETLADGMSKSEVESALGVSTDSCSEYSFGDSTSESCSYGSYEDGYSITIGYTDGALSSKSKYVY